MTRAKAQMTILSVWSCQKATKATVAMTDTMLVFPPKGT